MLGSRLYLQIYATVFLCLVALAAAVAIGFVLFADERVPQRWERVGKAVLARALPQPGQEDAQRIVDEIGRDIGVRFSLYASDRTLIAAHQEVLPIPPRFDPERENDFHGAPWRRLITFAVPDGRVVVARVPRPLGDGRDDGRGGKLGDLIDLIISLALILGAITLAAYPLVRRVTRRLEKFNAAITRAGEGDLSARVEIRGKDEVAQLANAYNRSAERIERLVNSNRLLLANASHELRTPLSRLRLGLAMIEEDPSADRLEAMRSDIGELDDLIDEILHMSRLDNGGDVLTLERVDLLALAAEEASRVDGTDLHGTSVEIEGDQRLLVRMIRNLIVNAARHGKPPISISLTNDGHAATLVVADQGPGIPEAARANIFEPFYRGQGKQNVAGFGLGLALVRRIAESHGGSVRLDEKAAKGARFVVTLPLTQPARKSGGDG